MRSFAVTDGRHAKAVKIEAVLCAALGVDTISGRSILDVGSGSGHIAAHFALRNAVTAADVENQLCAPEAHLDFVLIKGASLPFENASFDVIILNQVLTYIQDQTAELGEIKRMLKPQGVCYIALPNRLFPIDPHSKLPFVHYFPRSFHERILKRQQGVQQYVRMHYLGGMIKLFAATGFEFEDYTIQVLHNPAQYHLGTPIRLPAWSWLSRISPTNIFVLRARATQ